MVIEGYSRQRSQCKGYQEYEPWVVCHKSRIPLTKKMNAEYRRKQIGRSQIYRAFRIGGIITARNSSCGKVMFSQARVKNSIHGEGGAVRPRGQTPPPRRPLQRMVRIQLECILVMQFLIVYSCSRSSVRLIPCLIKVYRLMNCSSSVLVSDRLPLSDSDPDCELSSVSEC